MKSGSKSDKIITIPAEDKPTHKGWLGICPILIANPFDEGPTIIERHWVFKPLLHTVVWSYMAAFHAIGFMFPGIECSWPLRITGKVKP